MGAGGISYALRGIPAVLQIVEAVKEHAPDAYFINFTNPAGVITEVLRRTWARGWWASATPRSAWPAASSTC